MFIKDIHDILRDPECKSNIQCTIFACIVVIGGLCLLIYGLAWLSTAEKENAVFYGTEHLEERVKWLEDWSRAMVVDGGERRVEYLMHTHQYSDGHIK